MNSVPIPTPARDAISRVVASSKPLERNSSLAASLILPSLSILFRSRRPKPTRLEEDRAIWAALAVDRRCLISCACANSQQLYYDLTELNTLSNEHVRKPCRCPCQLCVRRWDSM